jgi:hypothetical protein
MDKDREELQDYVSAARFRLTSRSSAIVSLIPLPFGSETQGFGPSPMTKMLVILDTLSQTMSRRGKMLLTVLQKYDPSHPSRVQYQSHQCASRDAR